MQCLAPKRDFMSGICGICAPGQEVATSSLRPMLDALSLPGDSRSEVRGLRGVALGVAMRWSFQDTASIPGVSVTADADLVGRSEIARTLNLPPESNLSSAELLARLYSQYGLDCLKLLHGAFSVAIWDENKRRLIIAIDRLGIRSLYWCREEEKILFASRPGAVRSVLTRDSAINPRAVLQFLLFAAVPAPLTIDRDLQKLSPGTAMVFEAGRSVMHRYWDLEYRESDNRNVDHWSRELREGMQTAVHRNLEGCAAG